MGRDAVILSPHFDDAVLSCWHLLASAGEVLVVNVFAGEPPAGTLGWWDRLAGATDSAAAVRARIEEDRQALALAGRTAVNLPFLDSQYRQADQAPGEIVRGAARSARRGRPDIRAGQSGRPPSRPHRRARGGTGAPRRGRRRGAVCRPASRHRGRMAARGCSTAGPAPDADPAGERWASQLETTGIPVERMVPRAHRLSAEDHAGKLEAVLTYAQSDSAAARGLSDPRWKILSCSASRSIGGLALIA